MEQLLAFGIGAIALVFIVYFDPSIQSKINFFRMYHRASASPSEEEGDEVDCFAVLPAHPQRKRRRSSRHS